nr:endonuclease/exonuclease/phosphatase family protein [Cyclobacterium xiamenense]
MADTLAALQPDIILLQEVFRSVDGTMATDFFLKDRLGLQVYWIPARRKFRQLAGQMLDSHSGLSILSRHQSDFNEPLSLPSNESDGGRVAQLAAFKIAGQQLLFANVHLSHLSNCNGLKIRQVKAVLDRLTEIPFELGFLAGDFNSRPQSKTVEYLLTHSKWHIRDTYAATETAENATVGATFCHQGVSKRIDYIFTIKRTLQSEKWETTQSRVVLNEPSPRGLLPSDHFGVMTTLKLV